MPSCCSKKEGSLLSQEMDHHYFNTSDSISLQLLHWKPSPGITKQSNPVLLVHGLGNDGSLWQLTGDASIPVILSKRGYQVWAIDLRQWNNLPISNKISWTMEDYILKDIPGAIKFIQNHESSGTNENNSKTKVHYIGHSMGAILGYSLLCTPIKNELKSFVAIAGATYYTQSYWRFALCMLPCLKSCFPYVPLRPVTYINGINAYGCGCIAMFAANGCNITNCDLAEIQMNHFHSVPMALVDSLKEMTKDDGLKLLLPNSGSGKGTDEIGSNDILIQLNDDENNSINTSNSNMSYATWESHIINNNTPGSLSNIPILALVGDSDLQCREGDVLRTMNILNPYSSSKNKTIVLGSAEHMHGGQSFGHFDLILGKKTKEIVVPLILDWIG